MTSQTLTTPLTLDPEIPAARRLGLVQRIQLALVVLSICIGLFHIGRAVLAA